MDISIFISIAIYIFKIKIYRYNSFKYVKHIDLDAKMLSYMMIFDIQRTSGVSVKAHLKIDYVRLRIVNLYRVIYIYIYIYKIIRYI